MQMESPIIMLKTINFVHANRIKVHGIANRLKKNSLNLVHLSLSTHQSHNVAAFVLVLLLV